MGAPGADGAIGPIGPQGVTAPLPTLTVTKETIGYVFSAAHTQGSGANLFNINSSVSRTATGRYTVTLSSAHPNGVNYDITLGVQEDTGNRDGRIIQVVAGSQTATGFQVMILTGDNGGTADGIVDENWYFSVSDTKEVVTDIVGTNITITYN
jgi:hypothetical protein